MASGPPPPRRFLPDRLVSRFRTRAALGLGPATAPVAFFVPLGALLGPQVLNVLTLDVLAHLDVVVSVALATLGVFAGIALGRQTARVRPVLVCASLEAGTTFLVVAGAVLVLVTAWRLPLDATPLEVALMLGICASVSSAAPHGGLWDPARQLTALIADFDDVAPIVAGALVVVALREPEALRVLELGAATFLSGAAVAVAGWLLFEAARRPAERGVYVIGALVMLGGSAAYLALSPLAAGLAAGLFWARAPGHADTIIERDLENVQRPLVALLLLTAGATLTVTPLAIWLLAPFVLFRLTGKLAGSWLASRLAPDVVPADLGAVLIWPGIVGIAFALNFQQVAPTIVGGAVVSAVALGAVASEVLALLVVAPVGDH